MSETGGMGTRGVSLLGHLLRRLAAAVRWQTDLGAQGVRLAPMPVRSQPEQVPRSTKAQEVRRLVSLSIPARDKEPNYPSVPSRSAMPAPPSPEQPPSADSTPRPSPTHTVTPRVLSGDPAEELRFLRDDLGDCQRCKLSQSRRNIVFGEGNPRSKLVFVGEAPGADEDQQARPFVGVSGQLLTRMIVAMGLSRDEVYICNVVKCRPPANREPEMDEIVACESFLLQQLEIIQPTIIVTLGRVSAQTLLRVHTPVTRLRGRWHQYHGVKLMPTFHPAFLLRNPEAKRDVWNDLKLVMVELGMIPP